MKRGDLFRVRKTSSLDPKKSRVFAVVSRQVLIDSRFSTVTCAPIYSSYDALSTQVSVGAKNGLKHDSSVHCDQLVSLPKAMLTDFIGSLDSERIVWLDEALKSALEITTQSEIP
jgi:mRNA interferase MazF